MESFLCAEIQREMESWADRVFEIFRPPHLPRRAFAASYRQCGALVAEVAKGSLPPYQHRLPGLVYAGRKSARGSFQGMVVEKVRESMSRLGRAMGPEMVIDLEEAMRGQNNSPTAAQTPLESHRLEG